MEENNLDSSECDFSLMEIKKLYKKKDTNSLIEICRKSNNLQTTKRCNFYIYRLLKNKS